MTAILHYSLLQACLIDTVNMYLYRYQNMPTEALSFFNHARKDSEWGEKALFNMIMICLNPDNETLGGETFKPLETESG